jgi:hypothetical protein
MTEYLTLAQTDFFSWVLLVVAPVTLGITFIILGLHLVKGGK